MTQERGQATLELLLVLGVLAALLFGALSLARGYSARHALDNATALAARQIALDPGNWEMALKSVQLTVDRSLLGGTGNPVACAIYDAWGGLADPLYVPFGTRFAVSCSVPFQADIAFVSTAPRLLTATQYEIMERYP